jgi:hypothetical protein
MGELLDTRCTKEGIFPRYSYYENKDKVRIKGYSEEGILKFNKHCIQVAMEYRHLKGRADGEVLAWYVKNVKSDKNKRKRLRMEEGQEFRKKAKASKVQAVQFHCDLSADDFINLSEEKLRKKVEEAGGDYDAMVKETEENLFHYHYESTTFDEGNSTDGGHTTTSEGGGDGSDGNTNNTGKGQEGVKEKEGQDGEDPQEGNVTGKETDKNEQQDEEEQISKETDKEMGSKERGNETGTNDKIGSVGKEKDDNLPAAAGRSPKKKKRAAAATANKTDKSTPPKNNRRGGGRNGKNKSP